MQFRTGLVAMLAGTVLVGAEVHRRIRIRIRASEQEVDRVRAELRAAESRERLRGVGHEGSRSAIQQRLALLEKDLERSERLHRLTADEIERVRRALARDTEVLARRVLLPSVQVNGKGSVGGGTIIHSRPLDRGGYATFVVTAYHVVQKSVGRRDGQETRDPVEIRTYGVSGALEETLEADLVAWDDKKDIALLRLRSTRRFEQAARLAPRERLRQVTVFTPVYAVGCPLGHDPLPSPGEISTLQKEVGGERFWMMNAPTIFGNSGGGVFHRDTHELLGVAAMICTYDGFVSTPVPHLGIMVSLLTLYDWLDSQYLQFAYDPRFTPEACARMKLQSSRPSTRARIEY